MDTGCRADEYRDCAERVARELLGETNQRLSKDAELRWGNHGSLALDTKRGIFYCHERKDGGGVRWLLHTLLGLDDEGTNDWLNERGYIKPHERRAQRKIAATYDYADECGDLLFQVVRYDPKDFRQRRPDDHGGWIWSTKGVRKVLYRLPELLEALSQNRPIVIVAGEKDVDNLVRWNIPATTNPDGEGSWKPEFSGYFRGADVILIPDNDDAGYRHIQVVGAALAGIAARIRILAFPGLDRKGDVSDWIKAGGTVEQFWLMAEGAPDWVVPEACEEAAGAADKAKARSAGEEQQLIDELARLNQFEYDRRRREIAENLGIRSSTLDEVRKARRAEIEAESQLSPLCSHWEVEPWAEPIGTAEIVIALEHRIRRHIILTDEQAIAVALWILMTWVHQEAAVHSPILLATSAEANSGKTTLISVVGFLVSRGLSCVEASEAALFRTVELHCPTIIVDEADQVFVDNEFLRSVINSGWTRGTGVLRCDGEENTPRLFSTFCPKAIGMKGRKLPDTTLSRCIIIDMRRKKPLDRTEHFKHIDDGGLAELRRQCMRWATDNVERLRDVAPKMPSGFDNRLGDNWRLIFAVADLMGGEYPDQVRRAAAVISNITDTASTTTQLLADIREIFCGRDTRDGDGNACFTCDRISSSELVGLLGDMQDRPWPDWKHGKPITEPGLARLLKPFGVVPVQKQIDGVRFRGYLRGEFDDAWQRYLPGTI